jgi:hypothetical protein
VRERENRLADKEIKNQAAATPNRRETEIWTNWTESRLAAAQERLGAHCAAGKFHLAEKPTLLKSLISRKTQIEKWPVQHKI